MTAANFQNETAIRRFLLGKMTDDERILFEEKFIADENLFNEIRVVEDELIENYVQNSLSPSDKRNFERNFLTTEKRRQRVAFTRTMIDELAAQKTVADTKKTVTVAENKSVWNSIETFFKNPALAFGVTLALLILAVGGWFLLRNLSERPNEIVQQITPTPTVEIVQSNLNQNSAGNQNIQANTISPSANIINNTANKTNASENQNSQNQKDAKIVNPVIALFTGTVRSQGKTNQLNLPKAASGATLQLNLESDDYKNYRVEIVDADGKTVYQSGKLKSLKSKVNLFVPAGKLKQGDYLVKLSGLNSEEKEESAADYSLRVIQK